MPIGKVIKMKLCWIIFALCLSCHLHGQIKIEEARTMALGQSVTVQGIVINGDELGIIRYLQDSSAGIAAYPGNGSAEGFDENVKIGDEIQVTGILSDFNDLLEISPITTYEILSSNNALPEPKVVSMDEVGKSNESELIKLKCTIFDGSGNFEEGTIEVRDINGNSIAMFIQSGHQVIGLPIPSSAVDIVAISTVFRKPQLIIRTGNDLIPTNCVSFTKAPKLQDFGKDFLRISWSVNEVGSAGMRYGETPSMDNFDLQANATLDQSFTINGLKSGTIYYTQSITLIGNDSLIGPVQVYATESNSSGEIKVYFNSPVISSLSSGKDPSSTDGDGLLQALLNRIDSASASIDYACLNTGISSIVEALESAVDRGVQVRFLANEGSNNFAVEGEPNFPVVFGNANDLMHNKFVIFDKDSSQEAWVWTGSTNLSMAQVFTDPNHAILIQDQSLARTYVLEFDEMWGTSAVQPDFQNARFGVEKKDNTPHLFRIAGDTVRCYFSPSDQVSQKIINSIRTTNHEMAFGLLSFTRNEIGDALLDLHQNGKVVRGIINNVGDQGSEYLTLLEAGVDVHDHPQEPIFHHKYAIIDAFYPESNPQVITGSHNWTTRAERNNDENLLIIQNRDVANLFLQEFTYHLGQQTTAAHKPNHKIMVNLSPNPFNQYIQFNELDHTSKQIRIYDVHGKLLMNEQIAALRMETDFLAPGLYFIQVETSNGSGIYKIIKQ